MYHSEVRCSALTPSSMTPLLLLGLLSAEFPDYYFPLIFILPNSEYGFMLSLVLKFILALQFRKILFQLLFAILSIYIFHLAGYSYCKYFMHSAGISELVPLSHTNIALNGYKLCS